MMKRGGGHFSYGTADNFNDPKYKHYKYWSNPLETTRDYLFISIFFGSISGCYLFFLQISLSNFFFFFKEISLSNYLLFYENIEINLI